jgi:hypothetical protein
MRRKDDRHEAHTSGQSSGATRASQRRQSGGKKISTTVAAARDIEAGTTGNPDRAGGSGRAAEGVARTTRSPGLQDGRASACASAARMASSGAGRANQSSKARAPW